MNQRSGRNRIGILSAVLFAVVVLTYWMQRPADPVVDVGEAHPPGRWHFDPASLAGKDGEAELARVLSLPYMAGKAPAPSRAGVLHHDPSLASAGLSLYVSGHGPEARLIGMEGELRHRWEYPFERAFPEKSGDLDTAYFRRAHLSTRGELLAIFQGGGMIKLDRDSNLLWRSDLPYFNHLSVGPDGAIYAITKRATVRAQLRDAETILEDSIVVLSPDGELLRRISLLDCFASSAWAAKLHPLPDYPDILHTNTVELIRSSPPEAAFPYRRGDLLVSLREVNIVAFIDPRQQTVRRAWRGPWRAQHQPVFLPTSRILLFDNKGAGDHSRVLEFDVSTHEIVWEYHGVEGDLLASPEAGSCQRLANGNTLITDSERGRAIEITPEGKRAWEFVSPHRAGRRGELIATLFDLVRYPISELTFLETEILDGAPE